jgi:hypothetical protein
MMAALPHRSHLTPERRRALELLAGSRHGVNEQMLGRSLGFSSGLLASLVRRRLATRGRDVVIVGEKAIGVVRIRI